MARLTRGRARRQEIFGEGAPGSPATQKWAPYYSDWILKSVFGELWNRPALSTKLRVLVTLVALAVRGEQPQLKIYVESALRNGWTREEIVETLVHLAPYIGVPSVHNALTIADEVFTQEQREE